jgi:hypothetical protein
MRCGLEAFAEELGLVLVEVPTPARIEVADDGVKTTRIRGRDSEFATAEASFLRTVHRAKREHKQGDKRGSDNG